MALNICDGFSSNYIKLKNDTIAKLNKTRDEVKKELQDRWDKWDREEVSYHLSCLQEGSGYSKTRFDLLSKVFQSLNSLALFAIPHLSLSSGGRSSSKSKERSRSCKVSKAVSARTRKGEFRMLSLTLDLRVASFVPALERRGTRLETFVRHSFKNSGSLTIFLSSLIFFVNSLILSFIDFESKRKQVEQKRAMKKAQKKQMKL